MRNVNGLTVHEKFLSIERAIKSIEDKAYRNISISNQVGAINFAVEFGLITYDEWEKYFDNLMALQ